ncbi:MAG TPA: response regulator transcription factor [Terriglobales bacterium]|nr:response regulator transcription factor [Terriglobales bacterium]
MPTRLLPGSAARSPERRPSRKAPAEKVFRSAIRVFIVAASPLARAGLETLLGTRAVKVAGSVSSVGEMSKAGGAADVILVDCGGTPRGGLLDAVLTSGLASRASVVLLADVASAEVVDEIYHAGVRAVLPGGTLPDQLMAALLAAAHGLVVVLPPQAASSRPAASRLLRTVNQERKPLTRREVEVLRWLAGGHANKEIASRLGVSERTVKFHVASILSKLGATTRTDAVALGIRRGLVPS